MTWHGARKILCVRLDNLGDVLLTTPAFRALKTLNPAVSLTLLTSQQGAAIARFIPEIDDVIVFDVPWVKLDRATPDSRAIFDLVARLKREQFDAAAIFTVFSQNPLPAALLTYLAEIPLRLAAVRENPYALLTDWVPDAEPFAPIAHEVTRQLNLVRAVGARGEDGSLSLAVPPDDAARAVEKLRAAGIDGDAPWLILHPGASEAKRRYPPAQYIAAGRALREDGVQLVVTGVESERALAAEVAQGIGCPSLAGELSLGEFIGLVSRAPLLIANNTGPVHIAAGVGTPVVVLYAHTNPQHTPWRVPCRVLNFDVPPAQRSRNVLLQYVYDRTVPQPVRDAQPADIVAAVHELLAVETRTPEPEEQA